MELRWRHSGGDETESGSDNEDGEAAWKVAEAASCFLNRWRFSIGTTYLALAIVPPRPLVTQTNKTARTYHRGAVSDLGLDTAVFFKLYEVVERIPRPCAEEEERIKKHGMRIFFKKATTDRDRQKTAYGKKRGNIFGITFCKSHLVILLYAITSSSKAVWK